MWVAKTMLQIFGGMLFRSYVLLCTEINTSTRTLPLLWIVKILLLPQIFRYVPKTEQYFYILLYIFVGRTDRYYPYLKRYTMGPTENHKVARNKRSVLEYIFRSLESTRTSSTQTSLCKQIHGLYSLRIHRLPGTGIRILNLIWSSDRPGFKMRIPILLTRGVLWWIEGQEYVRTIYFSSLVVYRSQHSYVFLFLLLRPIWAVLTSMFQLRLEHG